MKPILIVGASGTVGSEIVLQLTEQGFSVRTTTSKKEKTHTNKVFVDLATGEGIEAAFEGIERAFIMSPGGYADQYKVLSPLIQEAKKNGLKKVVLMSAMGADADEATPLRRSEVELEKSGVPYNVIRPNWFMQNFNTFWIQGIRQQNKILLPVGEAKTSFIDARDIAAVAAQLLVKDNFKDQAFNLTGPESLDHHQVARAISEVTGKQITYQEIAPIELKKGLLSAGLPEDYSDFLLLIMSYLKAGYNAAITGEVKKILGREPISFQKYAQDYKGNWF
jgi:uncharacterized protein YbjT (DUF2867 family)